MQTLALSYTLPHFEIARAASVIKAVHWVCGVMVLCKILEPDCTGVQYVSG